jgi:hydroxymethylpyrimidine/phosphomethylpyrimidine kinase
VESNVFCIEITRDRFVPTALAVGGLDPSGGAGVLADAAAFRAVGAHPAAVVAVSTVQSGRAFGGASPSDAGAVAAAIEAVLAAQDVRAVKTGALGSAALVEVVARLAARPGAPPFVVDPVLASTTGGALIDEAGGAALRERLLPVAALITPNLPEAAALTGIPVEGIDGMLRAADALLARGCRAVLVKGGHLAGDEVVDVFAGASGARRIFREARLPGGEVRGTGCALASFIAGFLALGRGLDEAVALGRESLREALAGARRIGDGPRVLDLSPRRTSGNATS